ncbi:MAG: hypothetical protein K9G30_03035 [Parvibaculum sp.]|nr:hypothetical protein [Parvibaculum sp.]
MNMLALYANSYVNAFDVALSARSGQTGPGKGKGGEAANDRGFRKLFSFAPRNAEIRAA